MPTVKVQYKDAGALRFLKLLSAYFDFKVLGKNAGSEESNPFPDEPNAKRSGVIPGKEDDRSYEAFLTSKELDADTLRRDLWKRS